jgi:hypothetical protein
MGEGILTGLKTALKAIAIVVPLAWCFLLTGAANYVTSVSGGAAPTPSPGGRPTPIPLASPIQVFQAGVNATYGATNCTPHGDGSTDDTACLQAAVNQGDVLVKAGNYVVGGPSNWITMPSNRNIRCDTNDNAAGGSVAFTNTRNVQSSSWYMFYIVGNTRNDSIFWCQFRGVNYNASGAPLAQAFTGTGEYFVYMATFSPGNNNSGHVIAENDFNGPGGDVGTVTTQSSSPSYTPPQNITVEYNTAEHCGYRFFEAEAGNNLLITHNTESDCADALESGQASVIFSNDTFSYNTYSWPHGNGAYVNYGLTLENHLAENVACSYGNCGAGATIDNHTNTFSYKTSSGAVGSQILIGNSAAAACSGNAFTIIPAVNVTNTCTGNCTFYCPPGYSPGSNQ